MSKSPNKRWKIDWVITKDFAAYFESDTNWEARVVEVETGKVVATFYRNEFGNSDGWQYSGVKTVEFSEDGQFAIATNEDGSIEKVALLVS
jgi:hypothetical protein